MIPNKEQLSRSKKEIVASIDVAMGGRVAEEMLLGPEDYTTGWSSDLQKATEMAYAYVRYYGFKDTTILISADKSVTSEKYNYLIDQEVQQVLHVCFINYLLSYQNLGVINKSKKITQGQ